MAYTSKLMGVSMESAWDRFWYDRRGRFVVWQMPNVWLIAWAVLTFVSLFFTSHTGNVIAFIGTGFLAIWSILEILKGVNYFRRILGLVVLVFVIASFIKSF